MNEQPIIQAGQLLLRPFQIEDGTQVQQLAGDKDITATTFYIPHPSATTFYIPHPYENDLAEKWIATHCEKFPWEEDGIYCVNSLKSHASSCKIPLEDSS